jgi:hypothetical protein
MRDFVNWCVTKDLVDVFEDGTVAWKESVNGGSETKNTEKFAGGRDLRSDLSDDYKNYCHHMGSVWPFKLVGKGKGGKAKAPVAK